MNDAAPRTHPIDRAGSMRCTEPRLSRCIIAPSNRYVTVARPICGCGRTSVFMPGSKSIGPEVVQEHERADSTPRQGRKQAAHAQSTAEVFFVSGES